LAEKDFIQSTIDYAKLCTTLSMTCCSKSAKTAAVSGVSRNCCCYGNHAAGSKAI